MWNPRPGAPSAKCKQIKKRNQWRRRAAIARMWRVEESLRPVILSSFRFRSLNQIICRVVKVSLL